MPRSHQRSDVGEGGDGGCMVVFGELGDQCHDRTNVAGPGSSRTRTVAPRAKHGHWPRDLR